MGLNLRNVWIIAERDLRNFLEYRYLLIVRWLWFIFQIFLFGIIASRFVVVMENYFSFYATGMATLMFYITALYIGYDLIEEAEHGVVDYLLSLPVSRREYVLGRSVGGGLRSAVYGLPALFFVLWLIGEVNVSNFALALIVLFLFSFGLSGFSISIAATIKSHDKFDILMGLLDAFIVRLSTVTYPLTFMPKGYAAISGMNPLSFASDLVRWAFNIDSSFLMNPMVDLIGIAIFFLIFNIFGVFIYERGLEGGGWE